MDVPESETLDDNDEVTVDEPESDTVLETVLDPVADAVELTDDVTLEDTLELAVLV